MKLRYRHIYTSVFFIFLMLPLVITAKTGDRRFRVINAANGLADNSAQTLDCTFSGRMVICCLGHINIYDGGYFLSIPDKEADVSYYLSKYSGNYHLYFDNEHHMWLKSKHKVKCVDMLTETYLDDLKPIFRSHGVSGIVDDMFVDSSGRLWILSEGRLSANRKKYQVSVKNDKELQDIEVGDNTLLLFYNDGSMDSFDLVSGKFKSTSVAYDKECQKTYCNSTVLLRTQTGIYQIRNGKGKSILLNYDFSSGIWSEVMRLDYSLNNMVIKDNILYIASAYGYWTYDTISRQLEHYEEIMLNDGRTLLTDINVLEFDRQGGLWAGTEKRGLLYSKPRTSPFSVYTWDNPRALELSRLMDDNIGTSSEVYESGVYCRYTDSRGWQWKGSRNGVFYVKPGDPKEYFLSKDVGLLNHIAHCITEDNNHNIWLGTSCGIALVRIRNGKVDYAMSFDANDNVPIESFADGRCLRLPNGNIVMQSIDHIVEFRTKMFITSDDNFIYLHPKFVRLMVNGNVVSAGVKVDGEVMINEAVSRIRHLDFDYLAKTIKLTFSALNFFRPLQTYYRVRVVGSEDESWKVYSFFNSDGLVDSKGLLHYPLIGLEPGDYSIEVQASMFPDKWVTPPLKIGISIHQPWWQTTGLYIVIIIVLALLGVLNVFLYSRNGHLRIKCNLEEFELIKLLDTFIKRCEAGKNEIQSPVRKDLAVSDDDDLSDKFVDVIVELRPYIERNMVTHKVLKEVSENNGIDILLFYDLVSDNINSNPRAFIRASRLKEAAGLLKSSNKTVADIAEECHFSSDTFFIHCFKQKYGYLPEEYRRKSRHNML